VRRNRITTLASVLIVPLLITLALPALASEQTGKMNGTVYDPDGVPLAGVTVKITSKNLMGERKIQTSEEGSFLFFGLPPGKYTIEIDQSGFLPFKQENLVINIGGTASLDILLEVPTAEETVVVTAKRPVVDKEKTNLGQNYDDEFLEEVPVGRSYQSVAQLAPGVVGGSNPNVHGGSMYSNQYLVDGINTTDPATNTFASNFNFDAIKEVQVLTGGLDAEYGQATGGIINLVTKSGGNEFHIDTSFYITPDWLKLRDNFEKGALGEDNRYNFNLNVGGPIIKDKLWYFASVQFDYNKASSPPTEDFFDATNPDLLQHPPWTWFSVFYLGKLTWQASDKHKVTAMFQGDPAWIDNTLQGSTIAAEAEEKRYQFGGFYSLAWEALWSKNLFQRTQLGLMYSGMRQEPMSGCTSDDDPACRARTDAETGLSYGNYDRNSIDHRYRLQADSAWTYYLDNFVGDHEFKAGWNFAHTFSDFDLRRPGGGTYQDRGGRPYRFTEIVPDPETGERAYITDDKGYTMSVFLQDSWKIFKTLTFKPGIRIDYVRIENQEGTPIVEYATTSPRINLVWDATGDGKTVVRGGYNRYVDPGYFNVSSFLGNKGMWTRTWEYNPATGKYDIFYTEANNPDEDPIVIGSDNNTAPHTDEISFQVERELFTDFSLAANFLYRETKFLFEDDEVNEIWNQEGTERIGFKNGTESYIYRTGNPKEAWRRYWGFELVARKAFSDNWQMNASYTYSRSEGPMESYAWSSFMDNPRQDPFFWSWSSFDRRHVLKIDGSYHLPWGVEIGASVWWATGAPYSKYFKDIEYGSYYILQAPRGFDPDHPDNEYWNRTEDRMFIDIRLVWDLKELTGQQIDLIADMHNVLNLRYKTDLETSAYPAGSQREYGRYYAMTDGFYASLGIRYRY
jgi:hypothetical protein